jgi:hypothetical protein
LPHRVTKRDDR